MPIGVNVGVKSTNPAGAGVSVPTLPMTDLIHALIYPDGVALPDWTAAVGPNATCNAFITDSGTGLVLPNPAFPITFSAIGPTVNKPFTFVRVMKYAAGWNYYTTNAGETCYFASFGGDNLYSLSTVAGGFTSRPASASTGYIVERIVRDAAGDMTYTTTGRAPVSIGTGRGGDLFPFTTIKGNNSIQALTQLLYSGDNGNLVASGQWESLAAWIAAFNFGAAL